MLILILYYKYAVTALVGFLFFHTIHYVTCLRAEFSIYTLSDWKDAQCCAQVVWVSLSDTGGRDCLCSYWRTYFISSLCVLARF